MFSKFGHPIENTFWIDFFKKGIIKKENLKLSIESSGYYDDEKTPDWVRLCHYRRLDDEEFDRLFKIVDHQFEKFQIINKDELLHIVSLFIDLSDIGLIPKSKIDIVEAGKKNVEMLRKAGHLKLARHEEFPSGLDDQGFHLKEVQEFINFMLEQIKESQSEQNPNIALGLLNSLSESPLKFEEKIILSSRNKNSFYDIPILNSIEIPKFVNTFLSLSNYNKSFVGNILRKRYKYPEINLKLKDELPWLKSLRENLNSEKIKRKGRVSGHIIEFFFLKSLDEAIKTLEACNPSSV